MKAPVEIRVAQNDDGTRRVRVAQGAKSVVVFAGLPGNPAMFDTELEEFAEALGRLGADGVYSATPIVRSESAS